MSKSNRTPACWPRYAALLVLLLLAGCAGDRSAALTAHAPRPAAPGAGVPSLDELAQLPASPSSWISKSSSAIDGADPVAQGGGGNRVEGNTLAVIPSEGDDLAYAVYTQSGITTDKPVKVEFSLEPTTVLPSEGDDLAMEFWIGLSNYSTYRWEWLGPYTSGNLSSLKRGSAVRKGASVVFSLPLNSEELRERYISRPTDANGNQSSFSYVVLVTATGDPDRPNAVKIVNSQTDVSADYFPNKPHFVPVFEPVVQQSAGGGGKGGSAVTKRASQSCSMGWEDINAAWPAEEEDVATEYRVERLCFGDFAPMEMTTLDETESDWEDNAPIAGSTCCYSIVAINSAGESAPSPMTPIQFTIEPPAELRTEFKPGEGVEISWSPVTDAMDYLVQGTYDGDSVPTFQETSQGATSLLHPTPPLALGRVIYYTVTSLGRTTESAASEPMRGFIPNYGTGGSQPGMLKVPLSAADPNLQMRFLRVPGGTLQFGSPGDELDRDSTNEDPYQTLNMSTYYIMETEVTNGMWAQFIAENGYTDNTYWTAAGIAWRDDSTAHGVISGPPHWGDANYNSDPATQADYPVLDVSWYEANAFCSWAHAKFNSWGGKPFIATVSIPSEAFWEYAAEGPTSTNARNGNGDLWLYPWCEMRGFNGGVFNDGYDGLDMLRCNSATVPGLDPYVDSSSPVTAFPLGRSWVGAYNMAGNAAEWTYNEFAAYAQPFANPPADEADHNSFAVARGGRFLDTASAMRTSARAGFQLDFRESPGYNMEGVGVRLMLSENT